MINDELEADGMGESGIEEGGEELSYNDDVEADVTAALEELAAAEDESDGDEEPEGVHKAPKASSEDEKHAKETSEPVESDEDIKAPASWSASDKEWFNKQPIEAKRAFAKRTKDMERQFHSIMQERAEEKKIVGEIMEAVKPYEEDWNLKGITKGQAIKALISANSILERDFVGGMKRLAEMKGTTLSEIAEAAEMSGGYSGYNQQAQQPQTNGELQRLTQLVYDMNNRLQQQDQMSLRQQQEAEQRELEAVQNTTDSTGRYLYPELHDEQFVRAQVVPMYNALKQQDPTLSPSDRVKRVYTALTGKAPQAQTQVQGGISRNGNTRATKSVRGSTGAATKPPSSDDVPDSIEETVMQEFRAAGYDV